MLTNITVTDIKEIFAVHSRKGENQEILNRATFALSFCNEGQITYIHKGKKILSDPNHAIILPQGQSYTLRREKNGIFPVINFTASEQFCDTILSFPIKDTAAYIKSFERMRSLSLLNGNRMEILSTFYHILHLLSQQNTNHSALTPALDYIQTNYHNPELTNTRLANICNLSEVYFRRLFTKTYGMSPKQFLIDIRMNNAKLLLAEGMYKINAIAAQCGFSNPYHFCRIFKSRTGQTPSEYMKENKIYKI